MGNCFCNLRSRTHEHFRTVPIELNLNGLGHGRKITDQIFHKLCHFDLQSRNLLLDFSAYRVHDFINRAAGRRFESYKEVSLIGFGQSSTKLCTGSPGI